MFPYSLGVTTFIQGLYSLLWIVVLMDVLSPTLDLREMGDWSGAQGLLLLATLTTVTLAVGVVMHTLSRNLFRSRKDEWACDVLTSSGVANRLGDLSQVRPSGGPSLEEVREATGFDRIVKGGEFMHALGFVLMLHAPRVHEQIEVYRDQYRLARGFILPSVVLAFVMPFWDPVPAGHVGNFPLISFQLFFLGLFFAGVAMYAFRERSYRYAAARIRSYLTLRAEVESGERDQTVPLAAVR